VEWVNVVYKVRDDGHLFFNGEFLLYVTFGGGGEKQPYIGYDFWRIQVKGGSEIEQTEERVFEVSSGCGREMKESNYAVPEGMDVNGVYFSSKAVEFFEDMNADIYAAAEAVKGGGCSVGEAGDFRYEVCEYRDNNVGRNLYLKLSEGRVVTVN
jgi:hypothetical protein